MWLRATATDPAVCRISAEPAAVTSGLCTPVIKSRTMALAERQSIAYLTAQHLETPEQGTRLGAIGHGPDGASLAKRLCRQSTPGAPTAGSADEGWLVAAMPVQSGSTVKQSSGCGPIAASTPSFAVTHNPATDTSTTVPCLRPGAERRVLQCRHRRDRGPGPEVAQRTPFRLAKRPAVHTGPPDDARPGPPHPRQAAA